MTDRLYGDYLRRKERAKASIHIQFDSVVSSPKSKEQRPGSCSLVCPGTRTRRSLRLDTHRALRTRMFDVATKAIRYPSETATTSRPQLALLLPVCGRFPSVLGPSSDRDVFLHEGFRMESDVDEVENRR